MERFRLLERLGSGGMGTVYRAFDERLHRDVAVKEVNAADPARVLREAQAAARLNHPGIVTLYELGERDGRALLVSELVPGATLRVAAERGALTDREIAEIGADLCEALAHAHARGVVHRDVKPENVIVRDDDRGGRRAKLMDFGIAHLTGSPTLTAHGEVVGTLAYMSPEQAEGEAVGPESDTYSLALTLYECWTGVNPVAGANPAETARRIGEGVPPLRTHRPDLPEGLADVVDACLAPDRLERPLPLELRDCLESELARLDDTRARVTLERTAERDPAAAARVGRIAAPALLVLLAAALAGPAAAPGLALVLLVLGLPPLLIAPGAASIAAPMAAPLAAAAIPGAAPALAALARRPVERAALGALGWFWALAAATALGAGPDPGLGAGSVQGWTGEASVAAERVLAPMLAPESLAAAALFACAALALGWVLAARHIATALLGSLLWAAALDGALALAVPPLGARPLGVALAAFAAVALEFGLLRAPRPPPRLAAGPALPGST